jgi:hypothetical protein
MARLGGRGRHPECLAPRQNRTRLSCSDTEFSISLAFDDVGTYKVYKTVATKPESIRRDRLLQRNVIMKAAVRSVYVLIKELLIIQEKCHKRILGCSGQGTQGDEQRWMGSDRWRNGRDCPNDIRQVSFDRHRLICSHDFLDVMDMLDRRMNDRGKMWRHVLKVFSLSSVDKGVNSI